MENDVAKKKQENINKQIDDIRSKIKFFEIELGRHQPDDYIDYYEEYPDNELSVEEAYKKHLEDVASARDKLLIEKEELENKKRVLEINIKRKDRNARYLEEKSKYADGKFVNDLPNKKVLDDDVFERKEYAKQIADYICDPSLKSPYNVAIFGNWGVGKTVFGKRIQSYINSSEEAKKIKIVNFNASDYASKIINYSSEEHIEQQWGNLLSEFLLEFEKEHPILAPYKYGLSRLKNKWYIYLRYTLVLVLIALITVAINIFNENSSVWISRIGVSFSGIMVLVPALKSIISLYKPLVEDVKKKSFVLPNYSDVLGTRKRATEDLKILLDAWIPRKDNKIVVFVDDCDRCSIEGVMELIEAMHLFLSIDKLFFIFMIDEKVLSDTVSHYYNKNESVFLLESFLQKYIARTITLDVKGCAEYVRILSDEIESVTGEKCCLKPDEYDAFISFITGEELVTPRIILRLLNSIILLKKTFMKKPEVYQELDFNELMAWYLFGYFYTDYYNLLKARFNDDYQYLSLEKLITKEKEKMWNFGDSSIWNTLSDVPVVSLMIVERRMGELISQCIRIESHIIGESDS